MALEQTPEERGAVSTSIVVSRPRSEVYAFWRDFKNAPKFMANVESVTEVDALSSVWTVKDGSGNRAQWEMLVTDDEPDLMIAWTTSGNTPVHYAGRVEFKDAQPMPGTEIVAMLRHEAHPGIVGSLIDAVAGSHESSDAPLQSPSDLARLKDYLESHSG